MEDLYLGIDIGSVAVSVVTLDRDGNLAGSAYRVHRGSIREALAEALTEIDLRSVRGAACTGAAEGIVRNAVPVDSRIAAITAARRYHGKIGSLLVVGGERFGLIRFDRDGAYRTLKGNSTCAAGTGSFLDQQAGRLGLADSAELSRIALTNAGEPPKIASRCSVFAKTDLIHAQQEGYSLAEICDGLCLGLARNIADTLGAGEELLEPVAFAGGVSRNEAVRRHLERLLGVSIAVRENSHLYGAAGACLEALANGSFAEGTAARFLRPEDLVVPMPDSREYFYEPLTLKHSSYPKFESEERFVYAGETGVWNASERVETDLYLPLERGETYAVYLGIDIGSTSTKAALVLPDAEAGTNADREEASGKTAQGEAEVLAGFYTRTAGRPIEAVKRILETVDRVVREKGVILEVLGAGTTGSGRKFVGKIIGADVILDEITAHAKAAARLSPEIDTIIEIGGQDAKFTTLRNGIVTFSQMNTVCAAGTGSFIEEQAAKLGVPLAEYSDRAEKARAPLVSDRCTVFMERDINHYLTRNYSVDEILAAALFSVRENYLLKVASRGSIGTKVCFQGATAKNRALVAAFEQKLDRPIYVSRYCHLTGALGAALVTERELAGKTAFRGIGLYREEIPIRAETCELCTNHCRIRIAEVQGETVAYGFLCGRDYDTKSFVNRNTSGFDLLREYRKAFRLPALEPIVTAELPATRTPEITIGLPAALHLVEELPFWKYFFTRLGIRTVTSEGFRDALKTGKEAAGAEFCAPLTAFHGHVLHLAERADYVFLPIGLGAVRPERDRKKDRKRLYCYYTQYGPSLMACLGREDLTRRLLSPLLNYRDKQSNTVRELFLSLRTIPGVTLSELEIGSAYEEAARWFGERKRTLRRLFEHTEERAAEKTPPGAVPAEVSVVLTGRPYTILSPAMNKGIPEMFAALGVKTYSQEMLPVGDEHTTEIAPLLDAFHWNYASRILETASFCARTDGLYPVLVTSFKCAPDSFAIEYFKRILDAKGKPYLILQLDEHDSGVGYETRIEAGVRAFRNHAASVRKAGTSALRPAGESNGSGRILPVNPVLETNIAGKTLVFPNWDPLTMPLLIAVLRREGFDARLLTETPLAIRTSMRHNTGQCIPINAIAEEYIEFIRTEGLDPERTVLWMLESSLACNIKLYPYFIKSLLEANGDGMEKAGVYLGEFSYFDLSPTVTLNAYFAYLFGGTLRRLGCRTRPYETEPGRTDRTIVEAREVLVRAFSGEESLESAIGRVFAMFEAIPKREEQRPKVAIFGDLYVRDNEVMNQDIIRTIEQAGGEVITTPYSEYIRIISNAVFKRMFKNREYLGLLKYRSLLATMEFLEKRYAPYFGGAFPEWRERSKHRLPWDRTQPPLDEEALLGRFGVRLEHDGESFDNLLKIFRIMREYPDVSLFVQTNPAFCCPSLVTEAMAREIESVTGVPIVTITYDGTGSFKNDLVVPYLKYPRKQSAGAAVSTVG
jgi:predicted CoA-substrate-specific enzyme activase